MGTIITKAKNLHKIVEENYITKVGGTLTKTFEEINIYTTEEGINMYSNTSIDMKAEKETVLGEYQEPKNNSEDGELIESYYTDMENNKIDSLNYDKIKLIIKSSKMIGCVIDINLSDNPDSFLFRGKEISNDIIKKHIIKSDIEELILEIKEP